MGITNNLLQQLLHHAQKCVRQPSVSALLLDFWRLHYFRKSNELKNDLHSTPGVLTHYESARYTGVGLQNSLHPCFFLIDSVLGVFGVECRSLLSSFEICDDDDDDDNEDDNEDDNWQTVTA